MVGPYPGNLRIRFIEFLEAGRSRREAGEQSQVGTSPAIRWAQRSREDWTFEPMPPGGSRSLFEAYSEQILSGTARNKI